MTWLTAREIAGLPGMPSTEYRTRERLSRMAIESRPRAGREGGGGLEYDTTALPAETRAAIAACTVAKAASTALAQVDPAPVVSFAPPEKPLPAPLAPMPEPTRRPPSLTDKATADARMLLVNMVLDLEPMHGIKRACNLVALQLASGQASAELQAIARKANQRARADQVSARTLERYIGIYRAEGWWGLLPAPAPEPVLTPTTPVTLSKSSMIVSGASSGLIAAIPCANFSGRGPNVKVSIVNSCYGTNLRGITNPVSPDGVIEAKFKIQKNNQLTPEISIKYPGTTVSAKGLKSHACFIGME